MIHGDFANLFTELTGNPPFPWQTALYERFVTGDFPSSCDLPTGLGKTSVIAIWLLARQVNPSLPCRLAYVVNRRTVVDQTTEEVNRYKSRRPDLAVSTLRGQFADNRDWSADPSREAVICGTVDMIGSRLLFNGYGVGYKGKPLHAGFLGRDVLVVHDEAHLEPAFQTLLEGIQSEQRRFANEKGRFRVMELSATRRTKFDGAELDAPFGLTSLDREHPEVDRRIHATKKLILTPQSSVKLGEQLANTAIDCFKDSGRPILIFVRLVDDLKLVLEQLRKAKFNTLQLTGTMRGWEREKLLTDAGFLRFLPEQSRLKDAKPAEGTVFLVCTSAGEVGVNISADHLVCDLSTFESMAQRFGRVNRFGLHLDTEIHVIHPRPDAFKAESPDPQRKKTLELLERLNGNAAPDALSQLDANDRAAAFTPLPTILPTTDILFDAWSMTSIRDRMPGRPNVEPYLHGIREWEPPETQIAWREEVGVIVDDLLEEYRPEDLLDEYPLKPHELLRDRTERVWKELVKLADRFPRSPVWIVDEQGRVSVRELDDLAKMDKKQADDQLGKKIILLSHDAGALTVEGTLDGNYPPEPKLGEQAYKSNNDVSDEATDRKGSKPRIRAWNDDQDFDVKTAGMRHILCIDFPPREDNEDAPKRSWHWFELPLPKDNSKNATKPVLLDVHVSDVVDKAKQIVDRLTFDSDKTTDRLIRQAILLAAKFHDLGKHRDLWQRSIGRPAKHMNVCFGKSGRRWKPRDITAYRHEFGSLVDLQSIPEFQSLDEETKDLVQHLIGAHHGQARPHFTPTQIIDPNYTTPMCESLASETPRRFARLQRKFGRWGLAYLESILRAADWYASANPSSYFAEDVQ
jgi:CRISPR-associated endonuclease/helicase Cas3